MAFADLTSAMDNAEAMLKSVVGDVIEKCDEDLEFFLFVFRSGFGISPV